MKVKTTVIREGRHPGDTQTLAVLELPRAPAKGEYLIIQGRRYKVVRVDFHDNGGVTVMVEVGI